MDFFSKTNMTGIYIWIHAIIVSVCLSNILAQYTIPIHLRDGEQRLITSPYYPDYYYPNNADVQWPVIAPSGYRVMLHFTDFETQKNTDVVDVYEGWTSDSSIKTRIASFSGSSIPRNITSKGSYLWIHFTSNWWNRNRGFRAVLSAEIPETYLGPGEQGFITSPNYPNYYPNNANVQWLVIAPSGYRVMLHFSDFTTQYNNDMVNVYEGWTSHSSSKTRIASLSGSSITSNITSNGSYLWIHFTSNWWNRNRGFRAVLSAEIRAIHLRPGEQRVITSPNYPDYYPSNVNVQWLVIAPSGYRVMLHFTKFVTQENYDVVTVKQGWMWDYLRSTERASLSGWSIPREIISNGSYLWIQFTSNNWHNYKGFQALLSAEIPAITLDAERTEILTSQNYPDTYFSDIDTIWQVVAPPGYRVRIHFSQFHTENSHDNVTVYEGWTSDFSRSMRRASLSGSFIPDNITTKGSYSWLRFTSDEWTEHKGFRVELKAVIPTTHLRPGEQRVIASPNYPDYYPNNANVQWRVIAPSGYRVILHFTDFATQTNTDVVGVYEGWTSHSSSKTRIASLSGSSIPSNITSKGSYLWIHFTSNWMTTYKGFRAVFIAEIPEITLDTGRTKNLTSPGYPQAYDNNIDIIWQVVAPAGYRVRLNFTYFYTEPNGDNVTVYEGWTSHYTRSRRRAVLSGSQTSRTITSTGSYLWLRFTSNGLYIYRGFRAELRRVELPEIPLDAGRTKNLTSPGYPQPYDNNIDIIWQVVAPAGYRVKLTFTDFYTESNGDNVTVYEGWTSHYSRSTRRAVLSGSQTSRTITSIGSYLWVRFISNDRYGHRGFRTELECVEFPDDVIALLANRTEILTSPNFSSGYDNNIDFIWQVNASAGYRIMIHFNRMDTEPNRDFVYVYDGKTSDYMFSVLRASLSGQQVPNNITSIGSYLWIRFTSDHNTNWKWVSDSYHQRNYYCKGFKALITTVETTVISLARGMTKTIPSSNFPRQHGNGTDVAWQIVAPLGYRVHAHFSEFETESNDFLVDVHEGWTSHFSKSTLRASLSGRSVSNNITSMGTYLWIRFISNETYRCYSFCGFQVLLSAEIPVIWLDIDDTEYLCSPNYPAEYDTNLDLIWAVIAPEGYRVVVHFIDFNTEWSRDFFSLHEGQTFEYERSVVLVNTSGPYISDDFTTISRFLWIRFTSKDGLPGGYRYIGFNVSLGTTLMPVTSTKQPTTTQEPTSKLPTTPSTPASTQEPSSTSASTQEPSSTSASTKGIPSTRVSTQKPSTTPSKASDTPDALTQFPSPPLFGISTSPKETSQIIDERLLSTSVSAESTLYSATVETALKKNSKSGQTGLAISLVTVAVLLCLCLAGYIKWRKRSLLKASRPHISHDNENRGHNRMPRSVNDQHPTPDLLSTLHVSSSNRYTSPDTRFHRPESVLTNEYADFHQGRKHGRSGESTARSEFSDNGNTRSSLPGPSHPPVASRVQVNNYKECREIDEDISNNDACASLNKREYYSTSPTDDVTETPTYFTLESRLANNDADTLTDHQEFAETSFNEHDIADRSTRGFHGCYRILPRPTGSSTPKTGRSVPTEPGDYFENHYVNEGFPSAKDEEDNVPRLGSLEYSKEGVDLHNEEEYDLLNFRSPSAVKPGSSKKSFQRSLGQTNEKTGSNVYGSLDLPSSTHSSNSANNSVYDIVHGTSGGEQSDVDGSQSQTRISLDGQSEEAVSNYDACEPMNGIDYTSTVISSDGITETPEYFTLELQFQNADIDGVTDNQVHQFLDKSSAPVDGESGIADTDDEMTDLYQNEEIIRQGTKTGRDRRLHGSTSKQRGRNEDRDVILHDEKEYNSLNFRPLSDVKTRNSKRSFQGSFGQTDGPVLDETGGNEYGVLNFPSTIVPAEGTLYNDNVYATLDGTEAGLDGWQTGGQMLSNGHSGTPETDDQNDQESKFENSREHGKFRQKNETTPRDVDAYKYREADATRAMTKRALNPVKMERGEDDSYYENYKEGKDEEHMERSNEQIQEAESIYENQFGLQEARDEEEHIYGNTDGLSSSSCEVEDEYVNFDPRVGDNDAIDRDIAGTSASESIYSNRIYCK